MSATGTFERRDQIAAEIEYFARCIREDVDPGPSGWEGLADVRILQAIQQSTRFGRCADQASCARSARTSARRSTWCPSSQQPTK